MMLAIAAEGSAESRFAGSFDAKRTLEYLETYLAWDDAEIIVAENDGKMLGGVILVRAYEMWRQPICYIVKFWIGRHGRRTSASRRLIKAVDDWAIKHDCLAIYATATGELSDREQNLFENMMTKTGYLNVGPTLKKGSQLMSKFSPPPPPPPPTPPPLPPKAPPPTPPAPSVASLPKAEAYTDAKKRRQKNVNQRANLQIPLTSSNSSGSGVNTNT